MPPRIIDRTLGIRRNSTDVTGSHRHLRTAFHITLVTATIHVTTNLNLSLCYNRAQEYNH